MDNMNINIEEAINGEINDIKQKQRQEIDDTKSEEEKYKDMGARIIANREDIIREMSSNKTVIEKLIEDVESEISKLDVTESLFTSHETMEDEIANKMNIVEAKIEKVVKVIEVSDETLAEIKNAMKFHLDIEGRYAKIADKLKQAKMIDNLDAIQALNDDSKNLDAEFHKMKLKNDYTRFDLTDCLEKQAKMLPKIEEKKNELESLKADLSKLQDMKMKNDVSKDNLKHTNTVVNTKKWVRLYKDQYETCVDTNGNLQEVVIINADKTEEECKFLCLRKPECTAFFYMHNHELSVNLPQHCLLYKNCDTIRDIDGFQMGDTWVYISEEKYQQARTTINKELNRYKKNLVDLEKSIEDGQKDLLKFKETFAQNIEDIEEDTLNHISKNTKE